MTPSSQQAPDGQADLSREIVGLVEPTAQKTQRMQWHRHHGVGAVERLQPAAAHQPRQRNGELTAAFELERLQQFAQGALIRAATSRQ